MPLNATAMVAAANTLRTALAYGQLHSAAAGGSGTSNLCASGREAISWAAASGTGNFGLSAPVAFDGGAGGGAIYSITLWSQSSGGTFYGEFVLAGDTTFATDGSYTVTAIDFTGSVV